MWEHPPLRLRPAWCGVQAAYAHLIGSGTADELAASVPSTEYATAEHAPRQSHWLRTREGCGTAAGVAAQLQ